MYCRCLVLFLFACPLAAEEVCVPFDSDQWMKNGEAIEHLGRPAYKGFACLNDVEFSDGIIEVDLAVDGSRSYPGIVFRMQSMEAYERFYLRPHRAGLYPDALQYTPVFHGDAPWQLCHGEGYTAGATLPENEWFTLRIEVKGTQARVLLPGHDEPALAIHDLKHGDTKGMIGVYGPNDGSAYFSDFRYIEDDTLSFDPPPAVELPEGTLKNWDLSRAYPAKEMRTEAYPPFPVFYSAEWKKVRCEPDGLVNITRHVKRQNREGDLVLARTFFYCSEKKRIKLEFGYSDQVTLFHNSKPVFSGNSAYRSRDPSFTGIIGFHDAVILDAQKGINEIFMFVSETFGGWGVMARCDDDLEPIERDHARARKVWETEAEFLTPESIQYDPKRDVLYVTSMDTAFARKKEPSGFISKLSPDGRVESLHWITGLRGPCGMALHGDMLYVTERGALVEIDVKQERIVKKHPMPQTVFINDVAVDAAGRVYISDSYPTSPGRTATIYRLMGGKVELWLDDDRMSRTNGLFADGDFLYAGNSGDCTLKAIGLEDKKIRSVTCLGAGIVDGIRTTSDNDFVVTLWEGRVFLVSPSGRVVEVLETLSSGLNCADIEFVKEKNLLVIPTFYGNKVVAYEIDCD